MNRDLHPEWISHLRISMWKKGDFPKLEWKRPKQRGCEENYIVEGEAGSEGSAAIHKEATYLFTSNQREWHGKAESIIRVRNYAIRRIELIPVIPWLEQTIEAFPRLESVPPLISAWTGHFKVSSP